MWSHGKTSLILGLTGVSLVLLVPTPLTYGDIGKSQSGEEGAEFRNDENPKTPTTKSI